MTEVVKDWEAFELAAVPLAGAEPVKGLKRGRPVSAGELLARPLDPARGHLQAPTAGFLEAVRAEEIIIRRDETAVGEPPDPLRPADLEPPELARALTSLGLDRLDLPPGDPLIVSALDPEPGLSFSRPLLSEHRETLAAGLAALRRLFPGARLVWAGPGEEPAEADAAFRPRADYPWCLPALVKKQFTGRLDPRGGGVLDLRALFNLGRVFRTGRPLVRLVLTLGRANYFVPLGARPADLLASAHLLPAPGDAVVAGGLVRGRTLARLTWGLGRETAGLHLVRQAGSGPGAAPCRHCGDCLRACPAAGDCLECGACALACPARRPLLARARASIKLKSGCAGG